MGQVAEKSSSKEIVCVYLLKRSKTCTWSLRISHEEPLIAYGECMYHEEPFYVYISSRFHLLRFDAFISKSRGQWPIHESIANEATHVLEGYHD